MPELAAFHLRRQNCRFIQNSISNRMVWFSSEGARQCYITGRVTSLLDFNCLQVFGTLISVLSPHYKCITTGRSVNNELSRCGRKRCVVASACRNWGTRRNSAEHFRTDSRGADWDLHQIPPDYEVEYYRWTARSPVNDDKYWIPDSCLNFVTTCKDHPNPDCQTDGWMSINCGDRKAINGLHHVI